MNSEERFRESLKQILDEKEFAFSESDWDKAKAMMDAADATHKTNSEEGFKESLKEILDEKEFAFNESDWDNAKVLIDAGKARKRWGLYIASSAILLTLGILTYSLLPAEKTEISQAVVSAQQKPAEHKIQNKDIKQNSTTRPEVTENKAPAATQPVEIEKPNPVETKPQRNNSENPPVAKADQPLTKKPVNPTINTGKQNTVPTEEQLPVKTLVKQRKTEEIVSADPNPESKNDVEETKTPSGREEIPVLPVVPVKETQTPVAVNTNPETPVLSVSDVKNEDVLVSEKQAPVVDPKATAVNNAEIKTETTQNPETAKPDSLGAQNVAADDSSKLKPQVEPNNVLFIEAGAVANNGWNTPANREGRGISPTFGLFFTSKIAPKMAVSFGGQYNSINGLGYSNKVAKLTRYGVGEYSQVTVITPVTAHYINIPLKFHYSPDQKNTFGLGYNIGYLLNVDSKVETYTQRLAFVEDYKTYKTAGYTEGFKLFSSQLGAFYRRNLYKDIWLNAEIVYGLTDLRDDTFFNTKVFERNTGFKLSLVYSFFKR